MGAMQKQAEKEASLPQLLERRQLRLEERERWMPGLGWSSEFNFYTDGPAGAQWQTESGKETFPPELQRPERGWVWETDSVWLIEAQNGKTDTQGWSYGWNVTEKNWSPVCHLNSFVRRRFWYRWMLYDPVAYLAGEKESNVEAAKRRAPNEPVFRQYELYENERWVVIRGWSPKNLLPTERPHWTDANNVSRPREVPATSRRPPVVWRQRGDAAGLRASRRRRSYRSRRPRAPWVRPRGRRRGRSCWSGGR